jgi:hypothetical protein
MGYDVSVMDGFAVRVVVVRCERKATRGDSPGRGRVTLGYSLIRAAEYRVV